MEDQLQLTRPDANSLNVREIFFKYIRFLPLFVLSVALSLLVAYLYVRYATPVYRSAGNLVIQGAGNVQGDEKFEQLFTNGTKDMQSEIEYLRSRPIMTRVVEALQLNFTYFGVGSIKEQNIYKAAPFRVEAVELRDSLTSFSIELDFDNDLGFHVDKSPALFSFGQVFTNNHGRFRLVRQPFGVISKQYRVTWEPTISLAYQYGSKLAIAPKAQGTSILTIMLESTNPQLAADFINQLMTEYQDATIEDKNVITNQTLLFIDDRLRKISNELDSVTGLLETFQKSNNLINFEAQSSSYFNDLNQTKGRIEEQRAQLELAGMVEEYLRERKNNFSTTPSTLGLNDPTLSSLIAGYNAQQLERKALIDGNVPRTNLRVQQIEEQIEKLRQSILENLRNIKARQQAVILDLQQKSSALQSQVQSLPSKQQNLAEIMRQQQSKLTVYNLLQEKREEAAISLAATISDTKVLDQATPNLSPVKPNPGTIRMLAVAIGLVLPALFIFVLELMNDKVNTRGDIEKLTAASILGEVGHSTIKQGLTVTPNNRGYVAEQFRIMRSNIQYVLQGIEKPVILVTSSFSGEGKSFVSTNFSSVMALTGKRTVVLEFDIRKPKVLSLLNMPRKASLTKGLTNFILGKAALPDLPMPVEGHPNLFVIPCGPVPPNPAELLLSDKLTELFAFLKEQFDVIVIDTAPVGIVSDAMTLSKFAHATLYIVRQGYTFKRQISLIEDFYQKSKLPKITLILNDVRARAGYGYYGYGNYGYGYGSNYFEEDAPPPTLFTKLFGWLDMKKWMRKRRRRNSAVNG